MIEPTHLTIALHDDKKQKHQSVEAHVECNHSGDGAWLIFDACAYGEDEAEARAHMIQELTQLKSGIDDAIGRLAREEE